MKEIINVCLVVSITFVIVFGGLFTVTEVSHSRLHDRKMQCLQIVKDKPLSEVVVLCEISR